MESKFPIWDADGVRILIGEDGRQLWLTETQIRRLIGMRQLGVDRSARARKIILKAPEETVFPRACRKLQPAQPLCVLVPVSDMHRAYQHVAERCESFFDGRSLCRGSDGEGNKIYSSQRLSKNRL